jgi:hypothetical protein
MAQGTVPQIAASQMNVPVPRYLRISLAVLISALSFLAGCSKAENPKTEAAPPAVAIHADQPQPMSKQPLPQINEVEATVERVFKDSVLIDRTRKPSFIVGDFNGDSSQDIAVVLKPTPDKLGDLNGEFPNWILRDLSRSNQPGSPRLRVAVNDVLLAVIHGFGPRGWRVPEATQTYLLKNAAGSGLSTQSAKDFVTANQGKRLPQLRGDVIAEEIGGTSGVLYYSGATYSWYDSKTFKGDEPDRGMVHTAHNERTRK